MKQIPIRDLPIGRRLTLVIIGTTLIALLVSGISFSLYEYASYRRSVVRQITTLADAVGYQSRAALLFDDRQAAHETLKALAAEPSIDGAGIYSPEGHLIASWGINASAMQQVDWSALGTTRWDSFHEVDILRTIEFDGETIGAIRLRGSIHDIYSQLSTFAAVLLLVLMSAALVAHFLSYRLQRMIEGRLVRQANYDHLTDLPNRMLAADRLEQALLRARRRGDRIGVMFIDLDGFKNINDSLGHARGDELLVEAAQRLKGAIRATDTLARFGGDEFVVILPEFDPEAHEEIVAKRILECFHEPFYVAEKVLFITASIGISMYPTDGIDSDALFQSADTAMYEAKNAGRDTYRFYTQEMNEDAAERLQMEHLLRRALRDEELELHYQPLIHVNTGRVVGAEALCRWPSPELGNVSPLVFIGLAEETGLIIQLGEWVLTSACRQIKKWQDETGIPLRVAVNVSPLQLTSGRLIELVDRTIRDNRLEPSSLEIEITEQLLMSDETLVSEALQRLHEMGVRLSIDDFGTGYSAISYLKRYPFDTLKIDREFVQDAPENHRSAELATAITAMAHSLKLDIVGEGVETEGQLEFLRLRGCGLAQGYLLGRPMAPEDFEAMLEAQVATV